MKEYIQLEFRQVAASQSEMLIAALSDAGFEGFEEGDDFLKAFIASADFNECKLQEITAHYKVESTTTVIEETNWNAVWESGFQPVIVELEATNLPWAGIRAHFHAPMPDLKYEIVITPKMSFGTGHHATTYLMMQQMEAMELTGKSVFDFGTGTGVLAILAEKMGAASILAVDNDDWSIENAIENTRANGCNAITVMQAETVPANGPFQIILANINKNVILEHMPLLAAGLAEGGTLLLSGLLTNDEEEIVNAAAHHSLLLRKKSVRNNWIALRFSR